MFSKELENLIQATLEDGVLEEYEKAALLKRAQAEGVDPTELQIYINSILQKRQRERAEAEDAKQAEIDRKKKEAVGRICPKCQRPVPPMTIKCQCGYEFVDTNRLSSVQILNEKLNSITLTEAEEEELKKPVKNRQTGVEAPPNSEWVLNQMEKIKIKKRIDIITTFPVPNTKEDIIEFLALSVAGANKKLGFFAKRRNCYLVVLIAGFIFPIGGWLLGLMALACIDYLEEDLVKAWRAKFEQVLIKGRSLRGDAEFTQQLDYYEKLLK